MKIVRIRFDHTPKKNGLGWSSPWKGGHGWTLSSKAGHGELAGEGKEGEW
jgi:hypothetical protein